MKQGDRYRGTTPYRQEVALILNADDLLLILRQSPHACITAFGDEHSLRNALVRTVTYDPLKHEVVLVLETTGVQPLLRGETVPFYFVRLKESP